ncbi:MAG: C1 family peptidase [Phycisphaerae bacterium]|jgi:C1A family cysteine protease
MTGTIASSNRLRCLVLTILPAVAALGTAQAPPPSKAVDGGKLPPAVDLRPRFAGAGLTVRAQGGRNTCSVFAVVGAMEYALARHDGTGTRLSVEFLNWASNAATNNSADGSFFSDLWKGFEAYGVCDEADQPYQKKFDQQFRPSDETLQRAARRRDAGLRLHWIKPWDVTTGLTDAEFVEIKRTLSQNWPVCGGLRWPKKEHWTAGVLDMAPPEGVRDGHSVLLVGYRDDPALAGGGAFLIRNSGKGQPEGWMTYEYARAYMNDAIWIESPAPPARPASQPADAVLPSE